MRRPALPSTGGHPEGAASGVCFLWLLYFAQAKESDSLPARGVKQRDQEKGNACAATTQACNEIASSPPGITFGASASPPRNDAVGNRLETSAWLAFPADARQHKGCAYFATAAVAGLAKSPAFTELSLLKSRWRLSAARMDSGVSAAIFASKSASHCMVRSSTA